MNLHHAIRKILTQAIARGSTIPLNFSSAKGKDRLFYFGPNPGKGKRHEERLRVYDRAGKPCARCGTKIRRLIQAARSTYFCPSCQCR